MKKILAISTTALFLLTACGGGGGGASACADTKLVVSAPDAGVEDFQFTDEWGNYNSSFNSYRAIFTNFPKSDDSDFKSMAGNEQKLVIGLFNNEGAELTTGTYKMGEGNNTGISLESADGFQGLTSSGDADVGSVEITRLDDDMLCGTVDITDSNNFTIKGNFSVKNDAS